MHSSRSSAICNDHTSDHLSQVVGSVSGLRGSPRTPLAQLSEILPEVTVNSNQRLNLFIIFEPTATRTENKERIWKLSQEGNNSK